jgi:hypothetical protein
MRDGFIGVSMRGIVCRCRRGLLDGFRILRQLLRPLLKSEEEIRITNDSEFWQPFFRKAYLEGHKAIDSDYFDYMRDIIDKLKELRASIQDENIPSKSDIEGFPIPGKRSVVVGKEYTSTLIRDLPFSAACSFIASSRKPFRTQQGLIGVGPFSLEIGDRIYLVPLLSEPLILRKT